MDSYSIGALGAEWLFPIAIVSAGFYTGWRKLSAKEKREKAE